MSALPGKAIPDETKIDIEALAIQLHQAIYGDRQLLDPEKVNHFTDVISALHAAGSEDNLDKILAQKVKPPVGEKSYTAAELVKLFEDFCAKPKFFSALGAAFLEDSSFLEPSYVQTQLNQAFAQALSRPAAPGTNLDLFHITQAMSANRGTARSLTRTIRGGLSPISSLPESSPLKSMQCPVNTKFVRPFEHAIANVRLFFAVKARDLKRVQEIIREYGRAGKNYLNYEQRHQASPAVMCQSRDLDADGKLTIEKYRFASYIKLKDGSKIVRFDDASLIAHDKLMNTALAYAIVDAQPAIVVELLQAGASIKPDCGIFANAPEPALVSSETSQNGKLLMSKISSMSVSDAELAKKLNSMAEAAFKQPSGVFLSAVSSTTPARDLAASRAAAQSAQAAGQGRANPAPHGFSVPYN